MAEFLGPKKPRSAIASYYAFRRRKGLRRPCTFSKVISYIKFNPGSPSGCEYCQANTLNIMQGLGILHLSGMSSLSILKAADALELLHDLSLLYVASK